MLIKLNGIKSSKTSVVFPISIPGVWSNVVDFLLFVVCLVCSHFPLETSTVLYLLVKFPTSLIRCAFPLSPVFLETRTVNGIKVSQDLAKFG